MKPTILFVDDDRDVLAIGVSTLEEAGYRVQGAASGDIAAILLEQGLRFDLLITDIVLPGKLDGFALADRAHALVPEMRIVYSTGYGEVARIRYRGAVYGEFLPKPWRGADLLRSAAAALRHPVAALSGGDPIVDR
jgi:DNA-binding NtrC family response regulator